MPREKIGYFGGTFDPPHIGHLALASEAAYQFGLSRLYWGLTPDPPHKQEQVITPLVHRLEMLKLMCAENPLFEISRLEINRPGPHYTIDTIQLLSRQAGDADIVLLIGDDSLLDLQTWRSYADLITAVSKIGVMRRFGSPFNYSALYEKTPGLEEKVDFIDALVQTISSREIRQRVKDGGVYRCYTLPSVASYIEEHNLYRGK
ncbi:MAG: nicotinate (nicotinamide) nucleotide adenylyltransferase [Anaerolineales bacterium]|nr:nicotinate (nicotinamide) nucleotide adenylyltransferase [Anaerolineales bacterium]